MGVRAWLRRLTTGWPAGRPTEAEVLWAAWVVEGLGRADWTAAELGRLLAYRQRGRWPSHGGLCLVLSRLVTAGALARGEAVGPQGRMWRYRLTPAGRQRARAEG